MAVPFFSIDLDTGGGVLLATDSLGDVLAVSIGSATLPYPWSASARLMEPVNDVTPPMGGPMQRIGRLGARFSVTFSEMPALGVACGRAILAARAKARATGDTCLIAWPQPQFTGSIGAPVVNGAGQLGTRLVVKGLTASTPLLTAGTVFSMSVGGRTYLHMLTADATVDGSGNSTLSIGPLLRASPADAASLNFAQPAIEGFIQGHQEDWTLTRLAYVGLPPFTVMEAQ